MALRSPIVQVNGQLQQLQAADTLNAPQSGGDVIVLTNGNAGAVVIGAPVYVSANDSFDKAQANASTTKDVFGLSSAVTTATGASAAIMTSGMLSATTAQWDAVAGTTGGLTKNTRYYLSAASAGTLTATAPATAGQYVVEVGIGVSTTEMLIRIKPDILL